MRERGEGGRVASEPDSLERRGRETRGGVGTGSARGLVEFGRAEVKQLPERQLRWMNSRSQRTHLVHLVEEDPQGLAGLGGVKDVAPAAVRDVS
jgi:hypothetical protein